MDSFCSWKKSFDELFCDLPHPWKIREKSADKLPDMDQASCDGWKQYQYTGKVRFECGCGRYWVSVKGSVIFHYRLRGDENRRGYVRVWRLGQKCNKCCDRYEEPCWKEEEIERALGNLLVKVKEKFYGGPRKEIERSQLKEDMSGPHQSDLCQACDEGVCSHSDDNMLSTIFGDGSGVSDFLAKSLGIERVHRVPVSVDTDAAHGVHDVPPADDSVSCESGETSEETSDSQGNDSEYTDVSQDGPCTENHSVKNTRTCCIIL